MARNVEEIYDISMKLKLTGDFRNLQYYLELSGENLELMLKKYDIQAKYTEVDCILGILQHVGLSVVDGCKTLQTGWETVPNDNKIFQQNDR